MGLRLCYGVIIGHDLWYKSTLIVISRKGRLILLLRTMASDSEWIMSLQLSMTSNGKLCDENHTAHSGVVASVLDEGCASIFETDAFLPAPPVVPFIAVGVFSKLGAGGGSCAGTKQVSRVEKDSAVQLPLFCWCVAHMAMNLSVDKFNQPTK